MASMAGSNILSLSESWRENLNNDFEMMPHNDFGLWMLIKESKGSVELTDPLRRFVSEIEVIIEYVLQVDVFDFVFSLHSDMMK